ncbi:MAG TPA: Gldg family protein [Vicinamibacterales bacterium]|nr:Gldg family protein [Vicinamibacterales bacterium]
MLKRVLGLLGWLGVALVFAAVAIRFLEPGWQPYYNWLAIAGLALTLLYVLGQWREIARAFAGRQARFGSLAAASVVIVLAILVAINYLASRHDKRWDLTATKQYSLSDQTKKVLHDLTKPVHIRVFAQSEDFQRFHDRLDEYQYASPQVSIDYIDVLKKPAMANQYGVQQAGTVVIEYQGRTEKATTDDEQALTNALIKAVEGRTPKVYFTQGHGERDTAGADRAGYNAVTSALTSSNFVVDKVVLAQKGSVPADCDVLVIAGPKTDFLPGEIDMLKRYLARGGKVLFLLDPPDTADKSPLPDLVALLRNWDINLGTDVVVDVSGVGQLFGADASVPVAASYGAHPITDNFKVMTAYPLARSVDVIQGGVDGHNAQSIISTSPSSWAETDIKTLTTTGKVSRDLDKGDKAGPISLGAAVSAPAAEAPPASKGADDNKPETRLVAIGDSDFASNGALGIQGNRDLFLNTINWLAQQENLISIRPHEAGDRRITMTADQERRLFFLTVLIVPALILLAGVQTWWRRR